MVDLSPLVPPHPGVHLDGGDTWLNDRGEILVTGTLSNGDVHAFLLTPCDDNHRNGGDCEEHAQGAPAAQSSSAPVTQNRRTMAEGAPASLERMGALHGRLGRRYPYRGLGTDQLK